MAYQVDRSHSYFENFYIQHQTASRLLLTLAALGVLALIGLSASQFSQANFLDASLEIASAAVLAALIARAIYGIRNIMALRIDAHSIIGKKRSQEDYFFTHETPEYILTGVFDGHGGVFSAELANRRAVEVFTAHYQGNVALALDQTIATINEEVYRAIIENTPEVLELYQAIENPKDTFFATFSTMALEAQHLIKLRKGAGTTVSLTFLDKRTHKVTGATLGDSQARIYHPNGQYRELTPCPDWSDVSETVKLAGTDYVLKGNIKPSAYSPTLMSRINFTRSLGDLDHHQILSRQPYIKDYQMQPGDLLINASDGVWDYVTQLNLNTLSDAHHVVAIAKPKSYDNITAITVRI